MTPEREKLLRQLCSPEVPCCECGPQRELWAEIDRLRAENENLTKFHRTKEDVNLINELQ